MAAVVIGNLALLVDLSSPRLVIPDRKSRPTAGEVVLNLPKRESLIYYPSLATSSFESDGGGEARNHRVVARGKANTKLNAADSDAGWSDDEWNGNGEEERKFDREMERRRRLSEIEERNELEKKAWELQDREGNGEAENKEETEEEKRMRVRRELERVAMEQAERRATARKMFDLGQKAYGKGMYGRSIEFLEGALTIISRSTILGGEIQIWLAMAYEANNRHRDCIALYEQLERTHPIVSIRQQAADLKYISEAPKVKISQEELLPMWLVYSSYDSYASTWSDKGKNKDKRRSGSAIPSSRDFLGELMNWRPPVGWEKDRGLWVALTLWLGLVGAALFLQR